MAIKIPLSVINQIKGNKEAKPDDESKAKTAQEDSEKPATPETTSTPAGQTRGESDERGVSGSIPNQQVETDSAEIPRQDSTKNTDASVTPDIFRRNLDELDKLMAEENNSVSLALAHGIVQRTMIELKTYPEFDGIMVANDVRNIFKFLRSVVTEAQTAGEILKEKAVRKERKSSANRVVIPKDLGQLGSFDPSQVDDVFGE